MSITVHKKLKKLVNWKFAKYKKGNKDREKLLKQNEDTGNEFYYI